MEDLQQEKAVDEDELFVEIEKTKIANSSNV